ncbi:MAG: hypothetical protein ACPGYL_15270, partial [Rhodospirillaceae bacterium]
MLTQPNQSEIGPTGIRRRGLMLVLSSPSGAGKSTMLKLIGQQIQAELEAEAAPIQDERNRLNTETAALTPEAIQQRPDLI